MGDCTPISESQPLRQGDVFVSHPNIGASAWDAIGVVLTADCDIANGKTRGLLTYAPIIGLETYLRDIWLDDEISQAIQEPLNYLAAEIHAHHTKVIPSAKVLTTDFILEWIQEDSIEDICDSLKVDGNDRTSLISTITSIKEIIELREAENDNSDIFGSFFDLKHKIGNPSQKEPKIKSKINQMKSALKYVRQDVFFLNDIPETERLGHLIMLRNFRQIEENKITTARSEWFANSSLFFRVGRLNPPFKYALTQQFSMLFARIGLPLEYEELQTVVIDDLCCSFFSEGEPK